MIHSLFAFVHSIRVSQARCQLNKEAAYLLGMAFKQSEHKDNIANTPLKYLTSSNLCQYLAQ